jgi:hypothetical protein
MELSEDYDGDEENSGETSGNILDETDNEIDDEILDEREQGEVAGFLGRIDLENSVKFLLEAAINANNRWNEFLMKPKSKKKFFFRVSNFSQEDENIEKLYEEIYWIISLTGFIIADSTKGEIPSIPVAIIDALENSQANSQLQNNLIQLTSAIFNFIHVENAILQSKRENFSPSPFVAKTFLWFVGRWLSSYLFPECHSIQVQNIPRIFVEQYGSSNSGENFILIFFFSFS